MDALPAYLEEDPEAGRMCLEKLREYGGEPLISLLGPLLRESPDPMKAVIGITRFFERSLNPRIAAEHVASSLRYADLLTTLFSQSTLLSDILCRNPEYGSWLLEEAPLQNARAHDEILEEMLQAFRVQPDLRARCAWLRRYARREMLRIAAREVFIHAPFSSVVADISNLADAATKAALGAAVEELRPRFGVPYAEDESGRECACCVLALGKLGGLELNFSSDIDLLFLYSAPGLTRGGTVVLNTEEYYRKLCEVVIKILSEHTADGRAFRVDMRLRPYGRGGPLTSSLDNALEYYATYGRAWERQALIKARPCAGDLELGGIFLERLRSFIYPRYFDDATLEDIRAVKQQTEAMIAGRGESDREVKLGRGGIRDIEFSVQMLQLLHGGRWPELRTTSTLEAIGALGMRGQLSPFEAEALARNYVFLRKVEHRLQIEGGLQARVLPERARELELLARRLGYADAAGFLNVYRERARETRRILERFLATKGAGNLWLIELLDPESSCTSGQTKLREYGFEDPERARRELLRLANGPDLAPYTRDTARQFSTIAPLLLGALSATPDPDAVLTRFSRILTRLSAPGTLYEMLRYAPDLARYLVILTANSDFLAEALARDISLLDLMGQPGYLEYPSSRESLRRELAALREAADPAPALYRLHSGETLKVAMRELARGISVMEVGDELSLLAETILVAVLEQGRATAAARYGHVDAPFAILALGKLGGREMGHGSDLDLVFVYEDDSLPDGIPCSAIEYFAAVASHVLKTLKEPTRHGLLYDVDARLRPDGNKGVLAITRQRLRQYYREEAQFWERLALMKARAVAGTPEFAGRVEQDAADIAFSEAPSPEALAHMDRLRAKAAAATPPTDLKHRPGGIADIEYVTRLMQLLRVSGLPELRRGGVFGALGILREKRLLDADSFQTLHDGYTLFRTLLNRARLIHGRSTARVPDTPEAQRRIAAGLGLAEPLMDVVEARVAQTRDVCDRLLSALQPEFERRA